MLDVRTAGEYEGTLGNACDPRQGHIPGARHLDVGVLARCETVEQVRELVGLPHGAEIAAYCHSGSRSALAVQVLRAAGYDAQELRRLVARVVAPRRPAHRDRDSTGHVRGLTPDMSGRAVLSGDKSVTICAHAA